MFENIFQGSGAGSFATYTVEILIMWLIAGLIGLLIGYVLWHKYRRLCATLKEELAGLQLKLEQLETSITQLKLKNVELDAEAARWQSKYEALLADMDKKAPPPPPAGDATLSILEAMADDLTAIEGIDANKAGLQLELEQLKTSITQLKLKNVELDAEAARWESQYEALLAEMDKKSPPPPAGDATLSILEAMADDLTAIEGIDANVEDLLFSAGIHTFQDVANSKLETLRQILKAAGAGHPSNNPALWRKQAFQLFHGRKAHYEGFAGLKIGRRQLEALRLRIG